MKKVFLILLISCVFLLPAMPAVASPIINEVYPKPNTDEKEWIEIFNDSDQDIDLLGWTIMDELSSPTIIYEFNQESGTQLIEPLSFVVIELPTNKLNNSADTVKLISESGEIISQLEYLDSQSNMSFSLIQNNDQENSEVILTTPTKGSVNLTDNPTDADDQDDQSTQGEITTYPDLIISEVMACPESNDSEWIKIKNPNSEPVSLENWQAKDAVDNQISLPQVEAIAGLNFITVFLTNNLLNNSGDTISLFDPNQKLADQFTYDNCTMGVSLTIESVNSDTSTTAIEAADSDSGTIQDEDDNPNNQEKGEVLGESSQENTTNSNKSIRINSLLEITNADKSSTMKDDNYISKQITIKHKNLPKYAVISVIIGGMILSSSGLFFINIPEINNSKVVNEKN